ncbi:MAG: LicD family protein, partial [Synergistaceae bacterium]|nr:LicD family protein [Synergistaceae bacterium]
KFMKLFNEKNTRYKFYCMENVPGFFSQCGKILDTNPDNFVIDRSVKIGINIDLFVFDNAPDDDKLAKEMFDRRRYYYHYNLRRVVPIFYETVPELFRKIFVTAFRAALRILPRGYFSNKHVQNAKSFSKVNTKRVGDFTGEHDAVYDREILEDLTTAEFEGKLYKIPARYDEFLRGLYGDYMQLPPVEKQKSHHMLEAWTLNE